MAAGFGIRNRGTRDAGVCSGNAPTKAALGTDRSQRFMFHNPDPTYDLWYRLVTRGAAAPSMSLTTKDGRIVPGATNWIDYEETFDVYFQNNSGGATLTSYVAQKEA